MIQLEHYLGFPIRFELVDTIKSSVPEASLIDPYKELFYLYIDCLYLVKSLSMNENHSLFYYRERAISEYYYYIELY